MTKKTKNVIKFLAMALFLSHSIFSINPAFCDFSLDDFKDYTPSSGLSSPFSSNFTGQIPLNKKDLTPKEKEKIRLAKEELVQKKIPYSNEEFIKQIKKNKINNVKLMLDAGISPNADYFGEYALFYAVKKNRTDIALLLLEKGAAPNTGFDSPLFWAAKHNNITAAKALIKAGVKLDYTELVSSRTILYTALKNGNYDFAKLMIDNNAKIDKHSAMLIDKKNLYNKLGIQRF